MKASADSNDIASTRRIQYLALVPIGIALNLAIGTAVHTLKLPLYLDAVGTIVVTLLVGWKAGATVGAGSFLLGGLLTNPVLPWFSGTQIAIAGYTHMVGKRGAFKSLPRAVVAGIGLGVLAGIVSAPVIVYLFGGVTGSGASLVVAYLLASGESIVKSVLLSGLASEPLDKTLQVLIAVGVLRRLPISVLEPFHGGSLKENELVHD